MTREKWFKIGIVVLIVVVVAGIFVFKTAQNKDIVPDTEIAGHQNTVNTETYPLKITIADLDAIKGYGVPTVIDFGSDSCVPCKEMAPVLETLYMEWQGKAVVQFMDVWKYTDGVDNFPISVIPTQVFFNADGTPFIPSEKLAAQIQFTVYTDKESNEHVFTVHQGGVTEEQMRAIFSEMGVE